MRMVVTSLKMPPAMLTALRRKAWRESIRTGKPVSWGGLVRRAIEGHILAGGRAKPESGESSVAGT